MDTERGMVQQQKEPEMKVSMIAIVMIAFSGGAARAQFVTPEQYWTERNQMEQQQQWQQQENQRQMDEMHRQMETDRLNAQNQIEQQQRELEMQRQDRMMDPYRQRY
jgi:hypothetical protein